MSFNIHVYETNLSVRRPIQEFYIVTFSVNVNLHGDDVDVQFRVKSEQLLLIQIYIYVFWLDYLTVSPYYIYWNLNYNQLRKTYPSINIQCLTSESLN